MAQPPLTEFGPAARLLDLSRLFSRVGRGACTGIDRVEAAYLTRLLNDPCPLFSLVRTPEGFSLLDRDGTRALALRLFGAEAWGPADLRARLRLRANPAQRAGRADLRRLSLSRTSHNQIGSLLRRYLPEGTVWLNVGHANLGTGMFDAIHNIPGGRAVVLLHDTIPVDYPAFQRPETVSDFACKLAAIARNADLVICNSAATEADAKRHFSAIGPVPPTLVAHLGVDLARTEVGQLPASLNSARPWFLALGTIEPRKNHALLLDIWDHFAKELETDDIPGLVIAGRRGWLNEDVFRRLDTSPLAGLHIHEYANLDDASVTALLKETQALLMPSFAEGFGLPPAEALALGTPVIANDLPVYHEVLGNNPVYVPVANMYSWAEKIIELAQADRKERKAAVGEASWLPTWQEHFNLVLTGC
jgi:glycosyltransferase involved in cell wall biosynthesis